MTLSPRDISPVRVFTVACGAVYPCLVYLSSGYLPRSVLVLLALLLIAARIAVSQRSRWARSTTCALAVAAACLAVLAILDRGLAVYAYPVVMGLSAAAVFGYSLVVPPSLVEQFAGMRQPVPPEAVPYLRKVTSVWFVFLLGNAAVSAATACWGDMAVWTLYNGFLSYVLMGVLFLGEMAVRPRPASVANPRLT
jgi:uncharacterized membrane protein